MAYQGQDHLDDSIRACGAGNASALKMLYDTYASFLLAVVLPIVGGRRRAESALGETYVTLWRRSPEFDPGKTSARAWIIGLARREALRRRQGRAERAGPPPLPPGGPESADVIAKTEALPRPARVALLSAYIEGLPPAAIAARLATDEAGVERHLSEALVALTAGAGLDPVAAYVLGLMDEVVLEDFEAGMDGDPALAKRVAVLEERLALLHDGRPGVSPHADTWSHVARRLGEAQKAGMNVEHRGLARRRTGTPTARAWEGVWQSLWLWRLLAMAAVFWALTQETCQTFSPMPDFFAPNATGTPASEN